jgi:hypothetical protein
VRIKALFSLAALGFASLALAQAQNVVVEEKKSETVTVVVKETPKPPDFVFELHGFVSTTMFFQDALFSGTGQQSLLIAKTYTADKPIFGGDVRQTRLNFSVRGPKVMGGATPKAVVELDFFGSNEAPLTGAYGDVSLLPRMRTAYAELNWNEGRHIIQIGQQNMLTIGAIPQSLSHIAFPATYTAGTVGWRQPGFWGWHTFGDDLKFEFAWSVQKAGWSNAQNFNTIQPCSTGTTTTINGATGYVNGSCTGSPGNKTVWDGLNAGYTSGLPALEARGTIKFGKMLDVWVSGHWQTVDFNGAGVIATTTPVRSDLQTVLGTIGLKGVLGPVAFAGSAWYGKNTAPLLGNILQFTPANYNGDIFGYGAWGQVGYSMTKNLSLWYTIGIDQPQFQDILNASSFNTPGSTVALFKNLSQVGMIRYQEGGFAIGAEWQYTRTYSLAVADPLTGNQISVTGNYYF